MLIIMMSRRFAGEKWKFSGFFLFSTPAMAQSSQRKYLVGWALAHAVSKKILAKSSYDLLIYSYQGGFFLPDGKFRGNCR